MGSLKAGQWEGLVGEGWDPAVVATRRCDRAWSLVGDGSLNPDSQVKCLPRAGS